METKIPNSYVRERAAIPPEPPRAPLEGVLDEDVPAPAVGEAGRLRTGAGRPARDGPAAGLLRPVQLGRLFFNLAVGAGDVCGCAGPAVREREGREHNIVGWLLCIDLGNPIYLSRCSISLYGRGWGPGTRNCCSRCVSALACERGGGQMWKYVLVGGYCVTKFACPGNLTIDVTTSSESRHATEGFTYAPILHVSTWRMSL